MKFDDDNIVELSKETTDRLWKELIEDGGQLKVDRFRAVRPPGSSSRGRCALRLAIMANTNDVWDGQWLESNAKASYYFYSSEVKEIANGLLKMIGN